MKMPRLILLVVIVCALAPTALLAAPATQYSATVVATNGGQTKTLRQYADHGKVRNEMSQGGQDIVTIVRPDKGVTWTLMVGQKMYLEFPIAGPRPNASALPPGATFHKIGRETVEGRSTDKYRLDVKGKPVGYVWLVGQNLVRYQTPDGATTVVYRDFKAGPQPASLFELPAGYTKIQSQGR
jgi:hypothetical protein